ncbi:dephospho-CoA kinase [Seinonella peptonophila]|uniref:Dephospho-CoA kinase n=1 Tax=Seinonella peptonophila TaxID=112248 RepID=A0A1M4W344_9BACL|nr:dephospho-CoA kinase [Seinonella peptonophila]SHE75691.1 dephospho-CoA kinase [Seinonella peptonophila]
MVVGLTGGIATGKTTVSNLFKQYGAYIVDADLIAREVVEPGRPGNQRVQEQFGKAFFFDDGSLNRKAMGQKIFQDQILRKKLEQILHPLIRAEMKRQTAQYQKKDQHGLIIWDVPLLFESSLTHLVEKVIVVYVPREVQLFRLMERDQLSREEAERRIDAQLSIETKRMRADFVIDNQGSYQNTERQVEQLWKSLSLRNG